MYLSSICQNQSFECLVCCRSWNSPTSLQCCTAFMRFSPPKSLAWIQCLWRVKVLRLLQGSPLSPVSPITHRHPKWNTPPDRLCSLSCPESSQIPPPTLHHSYTKHPPMKTALSHYTTAWNSGGLNTWMRVLLLHTRSHNEQGQSESNSGVVLLKECFFAGTNLIFSGRISVNKMWVLYICMLTPCS